METSNSAVRGDSLTSFYLAALDLLEASGIPFLVGGTFAYARYTAIDRETKDLDLVVLPADLPRTLSAFRAAGYRTEVPFPHWLAKIRDGDHVLDVIFSSGNGVARVDDAWFTHAAESEVLGRRLRLCPLEELVWSKAFVQERERFDGADVLHLLRDAGRDMDWPRLVARFGEHWPVLLGHLVSFHFVYPDHRDAVPGRPHGGHGRAAGGTAEGSAQPGVLRDAPLARAVPPRCPGARLRRRPTPATRHDDARGSRDVDRRDRQVSVAVIGTIGVAAARLGAAVASAQPGAERPADERVGRGHREVVGAAR